jgi:hypothetical protein
MPATSAGMTLAARFVPWQVRKDLVIRQLPIWRGHKSVVSGRQKISKGYH